MSNYPQALASDKRVLDGLRRRLFQGRHVFARLAAQAGAWLRASLTARVVVRVLADALLVNVALGAAWLAYAAASALVWGASPPQAGGDALALYLTAGAVLAATCLPVFCLNGFYSGRRAYRGRYKLLMVAQSVTLSFVLFGALRFCAGEALPVPAGAVVLAWMLALGLLSAARLRKYLWDYGARLDRRLELTEPETRHVLVIGGAGYIGSALLPLLLNRGYRVRVLDRFLYGAEPLLGVRSHPRLEVLRGDFRRVDRVVEAMQGVDAVVHLGAIVGDPACALDEDLTLEVNVAATRLIAEVAKGCGVRRFVFASTCSVYGASDQLLDESSALNPVSLYARSKIACEQLLLRMADQRFAPIILRFGTIYGLSGRTRFDLVVNLLTAKAKCDGLITVTGGAQWRPFVHVEDAARAAVAVLTAPAAAVRNQTFNVGSDEQNYTIAQAADIIHSLVPSARLVVLGNDSDRRDYRVNFAKIQSVLGFRPHWTVEQGVRQVLEAIASGEVEDYRDPQYSNVQFLKKEGPARFVRHDDAWARDLLATLSPPNGNGNGAAGRCAGLPFPHRRTDQPAEVGASSNGNGHK
jgi:nucleoside-diphosphate-sugar epimerase